MNWLTNMFTYFERRRLAEKFVDLLEKRWTADGVSELEQNARVDAFCSNPEMFIYELKKLAGSK